MHSKFTDIGQFRNIIRDIKHSAQFVGIDDNGDLIMNRDAEMPIVSFHGTIKLHGTNAGVGQDKDGTIWYQGRKRNVTTEQDNAGFAFFANSKEAIFEKMLNDIRDAKDIRDDTVVIYGEWCGGNIQKGVAINGLDKMFVIFAVKIISDGEDANYYLKREDWEHLKSPEDNIYNINDYPSFDIDIDFNSAQKVTEQLIEITEEVEKECPVGKAFFEELDGHIVSKKNINEIIMPSEVKNKMKALLSENENRRIKLSFE